MARISRVLIADGSLATLNELGGQLRSAGCLALIELASSRVRARARAERPDIVMLGKDFSEDELLRAADELKTDPVTRRIPLVLTGPGVHRAEIGDQLMTRLDGMIDFPILAGELRAKLGSALRLKVMRAELLRRQVTFGRYGVDCFAESLQHEDHPTRVLFVRPAADGASGNAKELARLKPAIDSADEVSPGEAIATLADMRHEAVVIAGGAVHDDVAAELCADIRRNSRLFHLPIIYLEPSKQPAARGHGFAHGASEVLGPPFEPELLRHGLDLAVRQARLRNRLQAAHRIGGIPETNDAVTGLFDAEFLHKHLDLLIEDAFRWDLSLSVVTCVIPQLAAVRHDHGREAAAALQRSVASLLSRLVRGEDLCACLGDHAFCIVTPESALEATAPIMHRLRGVIGHTEFGVPDLLRPITLHAELGCAEFKPGDTVESLLGRAQEAALRAAA